MTFDINVPNSGQSPGIFPAQNNTNFSRLQAIISGDHVFNNTAQADDGVHKQVTLVARGDPVSLPSGTNGIFYNKLVSSVSQLFYYNGTTVQQITPGSGGGGGGGGTNVITGTVTLNSVTYSTISALPANVHGTIYLYNTSLGIQYGTFLTTASIASGNSFYQYIGLPNNYVVFLNPGSSTLNLQGKTYSPTFNGTYTYQIFYLSN